MQTRKKCDIVFVKYFYKMRANQKRRIHVYIPSTKMNLPVVSLVLYKTAFSNYFYLTFLELKCKLNLVFCSPGVIITEIHKRGGMDDEEYSKVSISEENVARSSLASWRCSVN